MFGENPENVYFYNFFHPICSSPAMRAGLTMIFNILIHRLDTI